MKKIFILLLTLVSIIGISITANAYGPGPGGPPLPPPQNRPHPEDRMEARRVLTETKGRLDQAQRVAYGPQHENLRNAFDLQADAHNCYEQLRYHRAIQLSLRAREIAQNIIEEAGRRDPPPPPPHRRHDRRSLIHFHLNL
jgi:hypothetical protein